MGIDELSTLVSSVRGRSRARREDAAEAERDNDAWLRRLSAVSDDAATSAPEAAPAPLATSAPDERTQPSQELAPSQVPAASVGVVRPDAELVAELTLLRAENELLRAQVAALVASVTALQANAVSASFSLANSRTALSSQDWSTR